jgi:hypothetical protein
VCVSHTETLFMSKDNLTNSLHGAKSLSRQQLLSDSRYFQHCVHKSPQLVFILSHMKTVRTPHCSALRSILIISFHLYLGLPSGFFSCSPHVYYFVHLILLHLIILIIFGEECKLQSPSLCNFLQQRLSTTTVINCEQNG